MKKTGDYIQQYFDACVNYWMRQGCSRGLATVRTIWWDCVETWNTDHTWTDAKVKFINKYRKYEPYGPVPEKERVEKGEA